MIVKGGKSSKSKVVEFYFPNNEVSGSHAAISAS